MHAATPSQPAQRRVRDAKAARKAKQWAEAAESQRLEAEREAQERNAAKAAAALAAEEALAEAQAKQAEVEKRPTGSSLDLLETTGLSAATRIAKGEGVQNLQELTPMNGYRQFGAASDSQRRPAAERTSSGGLSREWGRRELLLGRPDEHCAVRER